MDLVLRGVFVYFFLLLIFRVAGRRALAHLSNFDLVLVLVISEAVQQGMLKGQDGSITGAAVVVLTLAGLDIGLSLVKQRWPRVGDVLEGIPVVLIDKGDVLTDRFKRARVTVEDVLSVGRQQQGLSSLDQIEYAVLEAGGRITIVPKRNESAEENGSPRATT